MVKKLREILEDDDKAHGHYGGDWGGKKRFYNDSGHGYFKVGSKVKVPENYKGVHHGKIAHVTYNKQGGHHGGGVTYHVHVHLPKDHPDAVDPKDGETPQRKKRILVRDTHMSELNPKHEWDGK